MERKEIEAGVGVNATNIQEELCTQRAQQDCGTQNDYSLDQAALSVRRRIASAKISSRKSIPRSAGLAS
jgi:hypothetical protein